MLSLYALLALSPVAAGYMPKAQALSRLSPASHPSAQHAIRSWLQQHMRRCDAIDAVSLYGPRLTAAMSALWRPLTSQQPRAGRAFTDFSAAGVPALLWRRALRVQRGRASGEGERVRAGERCAHQGSADQGGALGCCSSSGALPSGGDPRAPPQMPAQGPDEGSEPGRSVSLRRAGGPCSLAV
jgi:hypothetical protein